MPNNNTMTSVAPKSFETKLRGAITQNGWSISESINSSVVNIWMDTPGS